MSDLPKVKICCIGSIEEAKLAIDAGADALGFVGPMPSGPGIIDDQLIAEIVKQLPSSIQTFLLTSDTSAQGIIAHHQKVQTSVIQLVDQIEISEYQKIRERLPQVKIVQVIHVTGQESIQEADSVSSFVDAILLDSGNPGLAIKELGGTGRTHNWEISRQIVEKLNIPVYLAGGLKAGNVQKAIKAVTPYGIDLCSGVRTSAKLDPQKLQEFFSEVKN
ncbi:phosphoribosylanthranilate isomerase [Christiangramia portivictoriae]|uniref:phosphoribosylanthranilate isomerase n=1 Tax=Christiangramia portivictoriae TaxID=326069 RepID=UPI0003F6C337|nr:phosphoribosylanthranilate isomerase [Christiangramia portivictoriae]